MRKYLSTFCGAAICGGFAFSIWPEMWKTYGLLGGFLSAFFVISLMWYMNHCNGTIYNPTGKMWLDQGWCIGAAGLAWSIVRFRGDLSAIVHSIPTFVCCLIGGFLAGWVVWLIRREPAKETKKHLIDYNEP